MIEHVYRRTKLTSIIDDVVVATCDEEIRAEVEKFGGTVAMTSDTHERASDRVAEAAARLDADIIVLVQGDEPMVTPEMVEKAVEGILDDPSVDCVNLASRIYTEEEFRDTNTVKVVMEVGGAALYFSREPIPSSWKRSIDELSVFKQVCVIPFRRNALRRYAELPPTPLEIAESIDMLRFLEHGLRVRLVETDAVSYPVDVPSDVDRVQRALADDPLTRSYL